jgi:SPP1 family predicted phage head-tail adaptor
MRSGYLRHTVELQSVVHTPDGMGGSVDVWSTEATVRAAIWPISANERMRSASPTMSTTHHIQLRYHDGLSPKWRVLFGTRYFNIVSVINKEERNYHIDLLCEEASA